MRDLAETEVRREGRLCLATDGSVEAVDDVALEVLSLTRETVVGRGARQLGLPCGGRVAGRDDGFCSGRELHSSPAAGGLRLVSWSCESLPGRGCTMSCLDLGPCSPFDYGILRAKNEIEWMFDSVPDPTFLLTPELVILRANRALARSVGKPYRDFLGQSCDRVLPAETVSCLRENVGRVFADGLSFCQEVAFPDGTIHKLHLFPLHRDGQVERVVARCQDLTTERRLQTQLLQAERMSSVGQLSAGIAHEINSPMSYLRWNLGRMQEHVAKFQELAETLAVAQGDPDPRRGLAGLVERWEAAKGPSLLREMAEMVTENIEGAERVQKIAADLRAFSHPAEGTWEMASVREELESVLRLVRNQVKHTCGIVREYADAIPPIRCHAQKLNQVFMNLVVNAVQAMGTRGTLTVGAEGRDDGVVVSISDTGQGIRPEHLPRIFDPFFTTKPVGVGTGLGLPLAAGIVSEHGGTITVESRVGVGSCFRVFLPCTPPTEGGGLPGRPGEE